MFDTISDPIRVRTDYQPVIATGDIHLPSKLAAHMLFSEGQLGAQSGLSMMFGVPAYD